MASVVQSIVGEYKRYKALGEGALAQLSDSELAAPAPGGGNSIANICWPVGGNRRSRFTAFRTSDGESQCPRSSAEVYASSVTKTKLVGELAQVRQTSC